MQNVHSRKLEGKVAIVTGGAGGIGLATARRFLEEGARVLLVDLSADALKAATRELGQNAAWTAADVSSAQDTQRYVDEAVASIVVTSSITGLVGSPGVAPYVTSKHAVMGLVKCAALELAPLNIRVNSVNPGPIENRMMRSIEKQASPQNPADVKAAFRSKVALNRYGNNDEIANVVLFLRSNRDADPPRPGRYIDRAWHK